MRRWRLDRGSPQGQSARRHGRARAATLLIASAAALVLSACAGSASLNRSGGEPPAPLRPIADGITVGVIGLGSGPLGEAERESSENARRTAGGAVGGVVGGIGGAAIGAGFGLVTSGACGPLFFICAPIGAIGGAVVGGVRGAAVGGVSGAAIGSLGGADTESSQDPVKQLENSMATIGAELGLSQPLVDAFRVQAGERWAVVDIRGPDVRRLSAAPVVALRVEQLGLAAGEDDELFVAMRSSMTVAYSAPAGLTAPITFEYQGRPHALQYWVADAGAALREEVALGIAEQATAMLEALRWGEQYVGAELPNSP